MTSRPTPTAVAVLATGGTIACTTTAQGALEPTLNAAGLVRTLPDATRRSVPLRCRDIARLDSSALCLADIDLIIADVAAELACPEVRGVVLTHGTDTLEDTAFALSLYHHGSRPVILTGAMNPADSADPDGPGNLQLALTAAIDPSITGVAVAFAGRILPARGLMKLRADSESPFATVTERNSPSLTPLSLPRRPLADHPVAVVAGYPGASGAAVPAALADGAQGLVVVGSGAGNVTPPVAKELRRVLGTVPVVITTRVPMGIISASYGGHTGAASLVAEGAVLSPVLRASQARIALSAALSAGLPPDTFL